MQQTAVHIDEHLLTERLIAGDPGAQELVYDHYGPALYGIILQVVADRRKAEEVLTKMFLEVFNNISVYRASGNITLFGWLMRMAREMALLEAGETMDGNGMVKHDSNLLQRFANGLSAENRTIFHLCYYKGLPKEAVARMLGVQPEEVVAQLKHIMMTFRKFLED